MQTERDQPAHVLCLAFEVSGMTASDAKRLRELEDENRRLKKSWVKALDISNAVLRAFKDASP